MLSLTMRFYTNLLSTWLLLRACSANVSQLQVVFRNDSPIDVKLFWHPDDGRPIQEVSIIHPKDSHSLNTFLGHTFSVQPARDKSVAAVKTKVERSGVVPITLDNGGKLILKDAPLSAEERARRQLEVKRCIERLEYFRDVGGDYHAVSEDAASFCETHPNRLWVSSKESLSLESFNEKMRGFHDERLQRNRNQPPSLPNYTTQGFLKLSPPFENDGLLTKAFESTNNELRDWFERNRLKAVPEEHGIYDPGVSSYESDCFILNGMPSHIKSTLIDEIQAGLERWVGWKKDSLRFSAFYGPRIYRNGSVLYQHVDIWETHVLSAIIPVSMRGMQEPDGWPLEITDHNGKQHNVKHDPGDVIFYESATCAHGKEKALHGREVASVFAHFRPKKGWKPVREGHLAPNIGKNQGRSEAVPLNSDQHFEYVHKIVALTLEDKIFSETMDAVLLVTSTDPKCDRCKAVEKQVELLGAKVRAEGLNNITIIGRIDSALNDSPVKELQTKAVPAIFHVKAGSHDVEEYKDAFDTKKLWKWLKGRHSQSLVIEARLAENKKKKAAEL